MAKVKDAGAGYVSIRCPGCKDFHILNIQPRNGNDAWTFNGDFEKPTFQPSLLVRGGHFNPLAKGHPCWCTYKERFGEDPPFQCKICHSFIRDGMIQFLDDCSHELAGKTLPLDEV